MRIEQQQKAIYQLVTVDRASLSNPTLLKTGIWNDDYYNNDVGRVFNQEYNNGTGIGVWRDERNNVVYIATATQQITSIDRANGTVDVIDNCRYFAIDYAGTIFEAELVICDLHTRLAILSIKNAPSNMSVLKIPKKENISVGLRIYVLAWRMDIDACSVMLGSISNTKFTYNGIHDDVFINVSDFFNSDIRGGAKTKYGGAVFNENNGEFIGMVHWTRLGNSYGVIPARQINKCIMSLPNLIKVELPELSATNDFFLGVHGRRLDPIRNVVLNEAYRLNITIANKGNIGMIVTNVLENSPASNAGITMYSYHEGRMGTVIWAFKTVDSVQWTYIDEHNSFDTFAEEYLSSNTCQTKSIQLLISDINEPQKLVEVPVRIERARQFFQNYENKGTLFSFLSNSQQGWKYRDFLRNNSGYGNQSQQGI